MLPISIEDRDNLESLTKNSVLLLPKVQILSKI